MEESDEQALDEAMDELEERKASTNNDEVEKEKETVLRTWSHLKHIKDAKIRQFADTEDMPTATSHVVGGAPDAIHHSSMLSFPNIAATNGILNQKTITPTRPIPRDIKDFLAQQGLLASAAQQQQQAPLLQSTLLSASTSRSARPEDSPLWKSNPEAHKQAQQYIDQKLAHERAISYLYTRPERHEEEKERLSAGTIVRPDPYRIKASYVNQVLLCEAFKPFSPCAFGPACFFANIAITRQDGPLPKVIQMIPPHKWEMYLRTGEKPEGLPELCWIDQCIYYNAVRDLDKPAGVRSQQQPKFYVQVDAPNEYRNIACRGTVKNANSTTVNTATGGGGASTASNSSGGGGGGASGVGQSDALICMLRHPMATDFFASTSKIPMLETAPDGLSVTTKYVTVRSWRERTDLIYTDGSRSDTMRLTNPATQLSIEMNPEQPFCQEEVIRLFIDNHRKQTLLRRTLPETIGNFIRKAESIRDSYNPAAHASWFNGVDYRAVFDNWIDMLKNETKLYRDSKTGITYRNMLSAKNMYELRKEFESIITKAFTVAHSKALSVFTDNHPSREHVNAFAALIKKSALQFVEEKNVRSLEDGFLALSDLSFRPFKKSLAILARNEIVDSETTDPEYQANNAAYIENNLPEDFSSEDGMRYFNAYISVKNLAENPPIEPDYFVYYLILIRANTAIYIEKQLIQVALTKPGGIDTSSLPPTDNNTATSAAAIPSSGGGVRFEEPVSGVQTEAEISAAWRGQEEYYRELKNIQQKLEAFLNSHLAALNWIQTRIDEKKTFSDDEIMEEGFFWKDLCPLIQDAYAPEDRKYVLHSSDIQTISTPHAEALTYLEKTCANREQLILLSIHDQEEKAQKITTQQQRQPPEPEEATSIYTFFVCNYRDSLFRQQPDPKSVILPSPISICLGPRIVIGNAISIPAEKVLCDFEECRLWCKENFKCAKDMMDAIRFSQWANGEEKRILPFSLWEEVYRSTHSVTFRTHSILLTLLLRLYVAHHLCSQENQLQECLLNSDSFKLMDQPRSTERVKDLLAKFKLMTFTMRTSYLLQSDPDKLEPLGEEESKLMISKKDTFFASQLENALRTSRNFVYQLTIFSWDHTGLLDAICTFEDERDVAMNYQVPSDRALNSPNEVLQRLSSYQVYYPSPKVCLCEDNLIDCAKQMSHVRFISDVSTRDPFVEGITKVQPGVCQVREMVRKNRKIIAENAAYRGYVYQSLACMLVGGYRDSTIRLSVSEVMIVMRWIQAQPRLDSMMYLVAQALRENSTMQIRHNPSFHDAVRVLFTLYHTFECKRVPESVNMLRKELITLIMDAEESARIQNRPDLQADVGKIVNSLAGMAEERFKDKTIEVFRRPRVNCLKHMCNCFKRSCIQRYTKRYMEHIRSGGDVNKRPDFGPMPSQEHQNAIVYYVRTLDPKQSAGDMNCLRKIGVSERGVSDMLSVFRMFANRHSDEEMTGIMNGMDMEDLLLCYFFYYMLRYQDTISLITLPKNWAAAVDLALHDRYGISPEQPLPMNIACLYFCSPLLGCGRLLTAVAQTNGAGAFGNDYMCMDWERGVLVCRPKKTNKPLQKKSGKCPKVPKAAQKYVACTQKIAKMAEGIKKEGELKKLEDLEQTTISAIKKDFRRTIRLLFKRPCERGSCVSVPTLGNLVQTCEVKEKKAIHEHTFCPKRGCGAATVFSTDMIDANGFSCTTCNAEQRENFRRPSCMSCGKILLTVHGDEIYLEPILAREPFLPVPVIAGRGMGFTIKSTTTTNRRFNARRKKKKTVKKLGQNPTETNEEPTEEGGSTEAQTVPKAKGKRKRRGGLQQSAEGSLLTTVNKKRRTDPVALQDMTLTGAAAAAAAAAAASSVPIAPKFIIPPVKFDAPRPLFDDSDMAESMASASTPSVCDTETEDASSSSQIRGHGIDTLYTQFSAGKKTTTGMGSGGHKRASSKASALPPTWRFYALVDSEEGALVPCWLCDSCNIDWLEEYQGKVTKQEVLHLIRQGISSADKCRNFLYSLENSAL